MVQDLKITLEPWFEEYKNACAADELIQAAWQPSVGDWFERVHRLDFSVIKKEERKIEILSYRSSSDGWWHVATSDGRTLLWNSQDEAARKTAKWIPRLDQLLSFWIPKNSHMIALRAYHDHLAKLNT